MVIVILEMYHIWYYGHFEKNVFGKNFRESLNPKGFVKNTPYLSIFTITGKDTMFRLGLSWKLHSLLCLWKLEIYIKTRKKEKPCSQIHISTKQTALTHQGFKSSQHISCYWIKAGFLLYNKNGLLTMEKIN